jgi:adenylate kinase family enzyme
LAEKLGVQQLDVDDFYWTPTDPPFTTKRSPEERVRLIRQELPENRWIITGSFVGWGDALIENINMIVFLDTPTPIRMKRLLDRETERYGNRIRPNGDMFETHAAFRQWASQYDDPTFSGRNRAKHEAWLAVQKVPVLRLDGTRHVGDLVVSIVQALSRNCPILGQLLARCR